jgi:hypothetical protein
MNGRGDISRGERQASLGLGCKQRHESAAKPL